MRLRDVRHLHNQNRALGYSILEVPRDTNHYITGVDGFSHDFSTSGLGRDGLRSLPISTLGLSAQGPSFGASGFGLRILESTIQGAG